MRKDKPTLDLKTKQLHRLISELLWQVEFLNREEVSRTMIPEWKYRAKILGVKLKS